MRGNLKKQIGWLSVILAGSLILLVYFQPVVSHLNTKLFATSGDGLKSYYCYLYHIRQDTSALQFGGMNYPYGESIFFTDNQPVLSEVMRLACKVFPGLADYAVGIWNGALLISIVLGALFLYLLLIESGLPMVLSVVAGLGIALLSPQVLRMGAHFSLSYVFVIPLAIWLILRFSRKPAYRWSILFAILVFWAGATHMYYVAFLGMMAMLFWLFYLVWGPVGFRRWKTWLPHILIQVILPVVLLQILVGLSSDVTDRGKFPYGFLYYRGYPESVFLPADRPYGTFLQNIFSYKHIDWEGYAYVGLVATIACLVFFGRMIYRLARGRFRTGFLYNGDLFQTWLFWGSFLILLYAFGIPFILGLESLVDLIGPIRQIRGLGRFAWVFFYVMNILAFIALWRWYEAARRKVFPLAILAGALAILLAEAHFNLRYIFPYLNRDNPGFTDYRNELPANRWVGQFDAGRYQSVLPLPYFHVGSENLWVEPACGILEESFKVSLKTGLPMNGVMLGRTSLTQTFRSYELVLEPYRTPEILNDIKSAKPLLLLAAACDELKPGERTILEHARPVQEIGAYRLAEIWPNTLSGLVKDYASDLYARYFKEGLFTGQDYSCNGAPASCHYSGFPGKGTEGYLMPGVLTLPKDQNGQIFKGIPSLPDSGDLLTVSFWINRIREDNMAKLQLEAVTSDPTGKAAFYRLDILGRSLKQLDGDWGLIEFDVPFKHGESLSLMLFPGKAPLDVEIDDLMIRMAGTDIEGTWEGRGWMLNNRFYPEGLLK